MPALLLASALQLPLYTTSKTRALFLRRRQKPNARTDAEPDWRATHSAVSMLSAPLPLPRAAATALHPIPGAETPAQFVSESAPTVVRSDPLLTGRYRAHHIARSRRSRIYKTNADSAPLHRMLCPTFQHAAASSRAAARREIPSLPLWLFSGLTLALYSTLHQNQHLRFILYSTLIFKADLRARAFGKKVMAV